MDKFLEKKSLTLSKRNRKSEENYNKETEPVYYKKCLDPGGFTG